MKHGFTLIEVIVTTVILGIFIIICIPSISNANKNFNNINSKQVDCLYKLNFYQKFCLVSNINDEIYYAIGEETIIKINEHELKVTSDNLLYLNNINYDILVNQIVIKDEYILFKVLFDDQTQCFILRGKVYEISSSEDI